MAADMRIVCPACSAAYDVPDSLVTADRVVRCARCSGEWKPVAVAAIPEPAPQPEPPPPVLEVPATPPAVTARQSAMDRLAAHAEWPRPSVQLRLAWAASIALLLLAAAAAYVWRADIIAAWPPSARGYAALGLHSETTSAR